MFPDIIKHNYCPLCYPCQYPSPKNYIIFTGKEMYSISTFSDNFPGNGENKNPKNKFYASNGQTMIHMNIIDYSLTLDCFIPQYIDFWKFWDFDPPRLMTICVF